MMLSLNRKALLHVWDNMVSSLNCHLQDVAAHTLDQADHLGMGHQGDQLMLHIHQNIPLLQATLISWSIQTQHLQK